ncbi:MAG: TonB-dependent receptor plug domain-containing protein [Bacteroidota bacterium]
MRNFTPLFFFFFCFPFFITAQTINGKIIDSAKLPVVGAYVIHLQSEHHAHSNENGYFLLNDVRPGDTLQVMHIGFETRKVVVQELNQAMDIQLEETVFLLEDIVVGQNLKSTNIISDIDTRTTPVNSSQEILRKVPGLFIGQHAGGGKAEQIFLRGFDIDHGTDVNITVDGIPVNMVSHAHGQGYADMHFIIPETIESVDFGKGPYYADKGNFATAGYVGLKTKDKIDNSSMMLEFGRFNTMRAVGMFNLLKSERHNVYLASEYLLTDGPFESSQNFNRTNFMVKYTGRLSNQDRLSVLASRFFSKWDASGQIPQRSVDDGSITRFGAIDDTEGGNTSRTNVAITYHRNLNDATFIKNTFYYSHYDFELYSNFTFFLEDPVNADQIRQKEDRQLFGVESEWNHSIYSNNFSTLLQLGAGVRYDDSNDNELSRTRNRQMTLEQIQFGDVDETNAYVYAQAELDFDRWLVQAGARVDHFKYNYVDRLATLYQTQSDDRTIVSPKLNFIYTASNEVQLFLKSGFGFHSNDTRVVLDRASEDILPAAYGFDVGGIFKPLPNLIVNTTLWYLFLEQEFVYVGDAGVVEPSGQTRRIGADLTIRYQINKWLFLNNDLTYTIPRSIDEPEDADYIPLAPLFTSTGGLDFKYKNWTAGIRYRYMHERPANEDNSIEAEPYFITDLNASYQWKNIIIGFVIENLFDSDWNETQFATESRLAAEPESVEEIHFTPGTPFFFKGQFTYQF